MKTLLLFFTTISITLSAQNTGIITASHFTNFNTNSLFENSVANGLIGLYSTADISDKMKVILQFDYTKISNNQPDQIYNSSMIKWSTGIAMHNNHTIGMLISYNDIFKLEDDLSGIRLNKFASLSLFSNIKIYKGIHLYIRYSQQVSAFENGLKFNMFTIGTNYILKDQ